MGQLNWYNIYQKEDLEEIDNQIKNLAASVKTEIKTNSADTGERDELLKEAGEQIIKNGKASIGMIQRIFRIGFNRAARIMDQLAEVGLVSDEEGTKPRRILMSAQEFENIFSQSSAKKPIGIEEIEKRKREEDERVKKEKELEQLRNEYRNLFNKYTSAIPKGDLKKLESLNGVFVWTNSAFEREQVVGKFVESYSPYAARFILTGEFTPGLTRFNGVPQILIPVVIDARKTIAAFNWVLMEANDRIQKFLSARARNLEEYNQKIERVYAIANDRKPEKLPHIVVIIDEASTLLDSINSDENADMSRLQRLILNGRTVGIHTIFFSSYSSNTIFDRKTRDLLQEYTTRDLLMLFEEHQKDEVTLQDIDRMSDHGIDFEKYIAELLSKIGYTDVKLTTATGDFGADIIASKDGMKYAFQCKCYSQPVGIGAVQEVFSGRMYYGCDVAAVITNNEFADDAAKLAHATGVLLWNRKALIQMMNSVKK